MKRNKGMKRERESNKKQRLIEKVKRYKTKKKKTGKETKIRQQRSSIAPFKSIQNPGIESPNLKGA